MIKLFKKKQKKNTTQKNERKSIKIVKLHSMFQSYPPYDDDNNNKNNIKKNNSKNKKKTTTKLNALRSNK